MEQPRQKIPKDGVGPRGAPDCYYTSRVLDSTFRYVKFVRKLRALEEEVRRGAEIKLKELKDKQNSDFFIRCDRRSLINNVARRVDLCMASYEEDVKKKRQKLIDLFAAEEEDNIRKFVVQVQAGAEAIWQDKMDRLNYLLAKRKTEHEDKYKDTPLAKCVHVLPCIWKLRAKEAQEIQLYQMREKESRKLAEEEFEKMWYELAMKESDALAARMEQDAIERLRRDHDCKVYTDYQLEQRKIQREKEKQLLMEESKRFKAIWDEDIRKEQEAENKRAEQRKETARERDCMIEEKRQMLAKQHTADKLISDTWDSLAGQGRAQEKAEIELRKRKERELDECNRELIKLKKQFEDLEKLSEGPLEEEARKRQEYLDQKRCEYLTWSQKTNREVRQAMVDQIKDRQQAKENLKKKMAEQDEYQRQLHEQLSKLVEHKRLTDAQTRKQRQKDLLQQIEYNKLLKERALQEEQEQRRKGKLASEEYEREIGRMLCRPFFSEDVHPFTKQVARGIELQGKCPCSKPNYCK